MCFEPEPIRTLRLEYLQAWVRIYGGYDFVKTEGRLPTEITIPAGSIASGCNLEEVTFPTIAYAATLVSF